MDGTKTRRLAEYLDDYPTEVAAVARQVLNAELGKIHLQKAHNIKEEIKRIIEQTALSVEQQSDTTDRSEG
jgi:hypothetical protein